MNINSFYSDNSTRCVSKPTNKTKRRCHPKNAVIVNFTEGEAVPESEVRKQFSSFGKVRAVIMCTMDACQAYVTFHGDPKNPGNRKGQSARKCVKQLLSKTGGLLKVNGLMWSMCRPEEWKKVVEDVTPTPSVKQGTVTVDQLTEIYTDFLRQNSSTSQVSLLTNSTQSFSSFSTSSTSSIARSCDSTATLTPFSFYPAQQSSGFLPLPPPYHTLPDTKFFRKTKIVPPPPTPLPTNQQIIDQYTASIFQDEFPIIRKRTSSSCSSGKQLDLECCWWNPFESSCSYS